MSVAAAAATGPRRKGGRVPAGGAAPSIGAAEEDAVVDLTADSAPIYIDDLYPASMPPLGDDSQAELAAELGDDAVLKSAQAAVNEAFAALKGANAALDAARSRRKKAKKNGGGGVIELSLLGERAPHARALAAVPAPAPAPAPARVRSSTSSSETAAAAAARAVARAAAATAFAAAATVGTRARGRVAHRCRGGKKSPTVQLGNGCRVVVAALLGALATGVLREKVATVQGVGPTTADFRVDA